MSTPTRRHADPLGGAIAGLDPAILAAVQRVCARGRRADAERPDLLHLTAVMAARQGNPHLALACTVRSIRRDSSRAGVFATLSEVLAQLGRYDEALAAGLRCLTLSPSDSDCYKHLSQVLDTMHRPREAFAILKEALRLNADDAGAYLQAGGWLQKRQRLEEAIEHYERCLRLEDHHIEAYLRLGAVRLARREWQCAADCYRRGTERLGVQADLSVGLARALIGLGRIDAAIKELHVALATTPMHVEALRQLLIALETQQRSTEVPSVWLNLGLALEKHGRLEEAATAFRQTLLRRSQCLRALVQLAAVYHKLGQPAQTLGPLREALRIDPDFAFAHIYLAQAFHKLGRLEEGLKEFAWQYHPNSRTWRSFEQPIWDGSDLGGRTILLWTREGTGLGDVIMFLRYAAPVKARGGRVVVECRSNLVPVVERAFGVDSVVPQGVPLPHFDVHAPLPLVPTILTSNPWPLPVDGPYISVAPALVDQWRERLRRKCGSCFAVGLAWGGHPSREDAAAKYIPLTTFAPLGSVPRVKFISLQIGPRANELLNPVPGLRIERLLDDSCSIADTAALVLALDLIVTVDTMTAHLAGALAKPVWTILSRVADWRWFRGEESPWYPTMQLFRQARQGDWAGTVACVHDALMRRTIAMESSTEEAQ